MFTYWLQPLTQIVTVITTFAISALGARLLGRDKREMLQYAVEIYNALPSDMTGTRADWQYYIDRQRSTIIFSKTRRREDKIKAWSYVIVGSIVIFVALFVVNPRASSIIPAAEAFIRFTALMSGIYAVSYGFGQLFSAPFEAAPSPERAIAILELLKQESTTSDLEGNDILLSVWTNKLITTVNAMFGYTDNITCRLRKIKNKYHKDQKRNRPVDPKENIAKNLELLEAALVRAQWEQADVMRTIRE